MTALLTTHASMRLRHRALVAFLLLPGLCTASFAQVVPPSATDAKHLSDIDRRLNALTDSLTQTQNALQQSLLEVQRLHAELEALRAERPPILDAQAAAQVVSPTSQPAFSSSVRTELEALHEQQDILQAEIKQHEQTKVETASKYGLRVTGLALFNAFSNAGVVDNAELPSVALTRYPGSSHGSVGATLRQTVVGIMASGPSLAGAATSAFLNVDFFGGSGTNDFGYAAPTGVVRMREAGLGLDWSRTTVQLGYTSPLISPLSPTSFATVAQPSLAGSGNLWTWSPQIRVAQRVPLTPKSDLTLEAGLIDPQATDYTSAQLDSPIEASRRPGVESRISYSAGTSTNAAPRPFTIGVGTYSARQFYSSRTTIHAWAVTGDWKFPLTKWVSVSGEAYRGRSLGGLGGGLYKDILTGTDTLTGLTRSTGVETAGGWSQLKLNLNARLEANASFGLDDAFASSFDNLTLPPASSPLTSAARNQTILGNLIFRPRASLILSPEYRRVLSWSYTGPPHVANIFTISAGYQF